jgi:hypothetical protein
MSTPQVKMQETWEKWLTLKGTITNTSVYFAVGNGCAMLLETGAVA